MQDISLSLIEFNDFCGNRLSEIEDIVNSFRREGQLSPIRVREHPNKSRMYQVVFGNRRLAAARELGWKTIAAEVVTATDTETLVMAFSENVDRRDFSDYEKAELLQMVHDVTGMTYYEVAASIGRSTAFVSQHVAMLHLFPDCVASEKERIKVLRRLTENHARVLARIGNDQERWNTAKLAVSSNLSVRELQKMCKPSKRKVEADGDLHILECAKNSGYKEQKEASTPSNARLLQEMIRSIISGLNSKDIRPWVGTISNNHFSMFPKFLAVPLVDRKSVNEYLFQVLRHKQGFRLNAPTYVDIRVYGKVAYLALSVPEEIVGSKRKHINTASRATIILERGENKEWKMVHSHWSIALPLDGFPASYDFGEAKALQAQRPSV